MSARMFIRSMAASMLIAVSAVASVACFASEQSYLVKGTSGYLSEWELSGQVSEASNTQGRTLVGSLAMKHTGLCSQSGPEEKAAEMRIRIFGARTSSRVDGEIVMNGATCTFSGPISGVFIGSMNCPDAKGVPVSFSVQ